MNQKFFWIYLIIDTTGFFLDSNFFTAGIIVFLL